jgi:hypothetical protein
MGQPSEVEALQVLDPASAFNGVKLTVGVGLVDLLLEAVEKAGASGCRRDARVLVRVDGEGAETSAALRNLWGERGHETRSLSDPPASSRWKRTLVPAAPAQESPRTKTV